MSGIKSDIMQAQIPWGELGRCILWESAFDRLPCGCLSWRRCWGGVSWLFLPKDNSEKAGMVNELTTGYLTEPDNTLDVLVLGDSLPLTDFDPWVLWQKRGITSYVCAAQGQTALGSLENLEQFCRHQKPRVVMVETNHLYSNYAKLDVLTRWASRLVPVLQYHDNWKKLPLTQMLRPVRYTYKPAGRGHFHRKLMVGVTEAGREPWGYRDPEIPTNVQKTLTQIKAHCDRMGAKLILFSMPSVISWEKEMAAPLEKLADRLQVPYLELNQIDLALNWETDTMDGGDHLNYLGDEKVSTYLASYLADTGLLEDHRSDPAYAQWNTDCANFLKLAEKATNSVR